MRGSNIREPLALKRRHRFLTVVFSLVAMLLSSAALVGYACPDSGNVARIVQMAEAAIPCAESMSVMDDEQPGVCHAHCQSEYQSADSFQPPAFADLMQMGPVLTVAAPAPSLGSRVPVTLGLLQRETGPPISVRNCCFRI